MENLLAKFCVSPNKGFFNAQKAALRHGFNPATEFVGLRYHPKSVQKKTSQTKPSKFDTQTQANNKLLGQEDRPLKTKLRTSLKIIL